MLTRKNIFVITCMLVLLTTHVFSQNTITRDEAYKIIKQKGLVDTLTNNVKASQHIIQSKTTLDFMLDSIISPEWNSWFFLIDLVPFAEWGHPCKYVFVNTIDASLIVIDGQLGPSFRTDVLLHQESPEKLPPADFSKKKLKVCLRSIQCLSCEI